MDIEKINEVVIKMIGVDFIWISKGGNMKLDVIKNQN